MHRYGKPQSDFCTMYPISVMCVTSLCVGDGRACAEMRLVPRHRSMPAFTKPHMSGPPPTKAIPTPTASAKGACAYACQVDFTLQQHMSKAIMHQSMCTCTSRDGLDLLKTISNRNQDLGCEVTSQDTRCSFAETPNSASNGIDHPMRH